MSQSDIQHEACMDDASHTLVNWGNFFQDVCEIDEFKFFHRKYQRGQWRPVHWVFGESRERVKQVFSS